MSKKDAKAYNDRGIAKEKLGKHDEALDNFNKAIELDPNVDVSDYKRLVKLKKNS